MNCSDMKSRLVTTTQKRRNNLWHMHGSWLVSNHFIWGRVEKCHPLSNAFLVIETPSNQLVKPTCSAWSFILANDAANLLPLFSNDTGIWGSKIKINNKVLSMQGFFSNSFDSNGKGMGCNLVLGLSLWEVCFFV